MMSLFETLFYTAIVGFFLLMSILMPVLLLIVGTGFLAALAALTWLSPVHRPDQPIQLPSNR